MGTAGIAHFRYDLNRYISELRRVSNLAATFLIKSSIVRQEYLQDVEEGIRTYEKRFNANVNPYDNVKVIDDLKSELNLTNKEYQILRMKDYATYIITDVFEEHGVIKYAKIGAGVVSGGAEAWAGYQLAKVGKNLRSRSFMGMGVILVSYGLNNIYESASPVFYEQAQVGPLRKIYRKAAELAGLNDDDGDFAYSGVEFALTVYAAIRTPVMQQHSSRLVTRYIGERPGTGKIFRYVNNDFVSKWSKKNIALKLYFGVDSARKFKATFIDDGYKFDGQM